MIAEVALLKEKNLTIQQLESDIDALAKQLSEMRKDLKSRTKEYLAESLQELEKQ